MTSLWKSINYKTPIKYFLNTYIREYDISKANISALLQQGVISKPLYESFLNMDKREREIKIGLWIRKDRSIYRSIQNGIIEAKRLFCESNNIEDYRIVSIKNDAIFLEGNLVKNTSFYPYNFKIKNTYTIYMQLKNLEVYYGDSIDPNTGLVNTHIDIKGIPDETLVLHKNGMLDLICDICYRLQRENISDTMSYLSNFYSDFIQRKLPKEYYRDFDSFSGFTFHTYIRKCSLPEISDDMIPVVDINRNLSILRDLMSIVIDVYNKQMR